MQIMRMEKREREREREREIEGFDSGFKVEVGGTLLLYQVMGLDDWA
jgi:hypothetical protein